MARKLTDPTTSERRDKVLVSFITALCYILLYAVALVGQHFPLDVLADVIDGVVSVTEQLLLRAGVSLPA